MAQSWIFTNDLTWVGTTNVQTVVSVLFKNYECLKTSVCSSTFDGPVNIHPCKMTQCDQKEKLSYPQKNCIHSMTFLHWWRLHHVCPFSVLRRKSKFYLHRCVVCVCVCVWLWIGHGKHLNSDIMQTFTLLNLLSSLPFPYNSPCISSQMNLTIILLILNLFNFQHLQKACSSQYLHSTSASVAFDICSV